ncbi:FAD-dependent oxidoreductase [Rahnella sp. CG8]|uniref:NAD(P)/FAD-dependent oxidoreductase n=1 Tax=Yersiniaceae TaxID=1903411 RepID=UPI001013C76B|nr:MULTISPECIES: NAD(P)/FAD-dependent oxidoreductase [Yersiniaceae]MCM2446926.1 FAD-dependent oxidoreductase [Rahnella sp. CG8]
MIRRFDVVVIGAGPAGMSAAIGMCELGLSVLVVDEQPAPGGQLWRAVESVAPTPLGSILGDEYRSGTGLAARFRASGAVYEAQTQVWQIEPEWRVFMKRDGLTEMVNASQVVLATGAQERPVPFPGWTLPGVLTVGAGQILLKTSRQVPSEPVWVVGSGPLPILYIAQVLRAGGTVEGWLDTSPPGEWRRALPWAGAAIKGWKELAKGLIWLHEIRKAGTKRVRGVTSVRALGDGRLQELEYTQDSGKTTRVAATVLLTHEGVVPSIHMTQALGCAHSWNTQQTCLSPVLDDWGQTSRQGVYVAGDGADIGGGQAACVRGELVALGVGQRAGRISAETAEKQAGALREKLLRLLRLRPMLDALYPPPPRIFSPSDETIVCRCEELTAGDIRSAAAIASPGMNQIKAFTRAGMGPCQGRQCGYTIAHIVAAGQKRQVSHSDFFRIRPPLKPLTLGELVSLKTEDEQNT